MTAQNWDPKRYARNARFVSDLGMPVVALLDPQPGERILDLGCGDGALTEKLAALGCTVVGVDSSAEQVAATRARGIDAHVADCRRIEYNREFDAVFSNAVLHWVKPPEDAIAGVARALKPGGRFVGEFGGSGNVERIRSALEAALEARGVDPRPLNPWYFPTVEEYSGILCAHGFVVDKCALIPRPTKLPGDMVDWLETFAEPFAAALATDERRPFFADVQDRLRETLCDARGTWHADYVRLRFAARFAAD
jgi:trans-aconitate methyltransferase